MNINKTPFINPINYKLNHYIYLDNNLFRILKREPVFWSNFFAFFDRNNPELLENTAIIFTWFQLLEDLNLGKIMKEIKNQPDFKKTRKINNNENIDTINQRLDENFEILLNIIRKIVDLQKENLLKRIDTSIQHAGPHATALINMTLLKYKNFITNEEYIEELAINLAWEILISELTTVSSCDILIAGWHDLAHTKKNNVMNFYRLVDKRISLQNSNFFNLKSNNDLCDNEILTYASFGFNGHPVISITFDGVKKIEHRVSNIKYSLNLLSKVDNWSIKPTGGKIICLQKEEKKIINANIIPFDISFSS